MQTSISDTKGFRQACLEAPLASFKTDPRIVQIFEHVSVPFGEEYAKIIQEEYPVLSLLARSFQKNDAMGGSVERVLLDGIPLSPTTLRYVKVAGDLLKAGLQPGHTVVEIGGGYGGQCLVLDTIQPWRPRYRIFDLPEVAGLQQRYLAHNRLDNVVWGPPEKYTKWDFCISNFAFSECTRAVQDWYLENVILRSIHGYMVCNFISHLYGVGSYSLQELGDKIPGVKSSLDTPHTQYNCVVLQW